VLVNLSERMTHESLAAILNKRTSAILPFLETFSTCSSSFCSDIPVIPRISARSLPERSSPGSRRCDSRACVRVQTLGEWNAAGILTYRSRLSFYRRFLRAAGLRSMRLSQRDRQKGCLQDRRPQRFEGYINGSDMQQARYISRGFRCMRSKAKGRRAIMR
jgi:hypothetical protein